MKRLNADTKIHLARVQAFFVNWKVLLEKKYFCFTFQGKKKKKNNYQVSKQFQRTHSVLFICCIEL